MTLTNEEFLALAEKHGPKLCTAEAGDGPALLMANWTEIHNVLMIGLASNDETERRRTVLVVHGLRNWYSTLGEGDPDDLKGAAHVAAGVAGLEEVHGNLYRFLGDTLVRRGNDVDAKHWYSTAISAYNANQDKVPNAARWITSCTRGLGDIAFRAGDYAEAQQRFRTALEGFRTLPEPDLLGVANCLRRVGNVAFMREFPQVAMGYYNEAWKLYVKVGPAIDAGDCLAGMARAALKTDSHVDAMHHLYAAIAMFEQVNDVTGMSRALALRATIHQSLHQTEAAERDQAVANQLHRKLKLPGDEATDVIR